MKSGLDSQEGAEGHGHGKGGVASSQRGVGQGEGSRGEEGWKARGRVREDRHGVESKWRQEGKGEERWKPRGEEERWTPKERGKPRREEGWIPKHGKREEGGRTPKWSKGEGQGGTRGGGGEWNPRGDERGKQRGKEKGWAPKQGRGEEREKLAVFRRKNDGVENDDIGRNSCSDHRNAVSDHGDGGGDRGDRSGGNWDDGHAVSNSKGEAGANSHSEARGGAAAMPKVKGDHKDGASGVQSKLSEGKGKASHSKSVQRSRQLKDRHKGSQGNHNRKAMADKKMRGGMI